MNRILHFEKIKDIDRYMTFLGKYFFKFSFSRSKRYTSWTQVIFFLWQIFFSFLEKLLTAAYITDHMNLLWSPCNFLGLSSSLNMIPLPAENIILYDIILHFWTNFSNLINSQSIQKAWKATGKKKEKNRNSLPVVNH